MESNVANILQNLRKQFGVDEQSLDSENIEYLLQFKTELYMKRVTIFSFYNPMC